MSIEVLVVSTYGTGTTLPFAEIIVPIDPDSLDTRSLVTARTLADQMGASISVLAVIDPDSELPAEWRSTLSGLVSDLAPTAARAVVSRAFTVADGVEAAIADNPSSVICMTTEAPGRLRNALDLSSAGAVAHHVRCPLVLCGPHAQPFVSALSELVAFVDTSDLADNVVEIAVGWAAALGVRLWIVQVLEPAEAHRAADVNETVHVAALAHRHAHPDVDIQWDVIRDRHAADGIVRYLRDVRPDALAILGTHGRSGWQALRLGSVAFRAVHEAPRPVVLIPARPG